MSAREEGRGVRDVEGKRGTILGVRLDEFGWLDLMNEVRRSAVDELYGR